MLLFSDKFVELRGIFSQVQSTRALPQRQSSVITEDYTRPSLMAELLSQGSSSFGHLPVEKGHTQPLI
jgi:hypothetical protein